MRNDILKIVDELVAVDPSLEKERDYLQRFATVLSDKKPDTHFRAEFAESLRAKLFARLAEPAARQALIGRESGSDEIKKVTFASIKKIAFALGGMVAVLLLVVLTQQYWGGAGRPVKRLAQVAADRVEIAKLGSQAFGLLADQGNVQGLGAGASARTQFGGGSAVSLPMPAGSGRGGLSSKDIAVESVVAPDIGRIYPPEPIWQYQYVYQGEQVEALPASLPVLRRQTDALAQSLGSLAQSFGLGLVDLPKLVNPELLYVMFAESRQNGFMVNVNLEMGDISLNRIWYEPMPVPAPLAESRSGQAYEPLTQADMLPESEIVSMADSFLADRGISTDVYRAGAVYDNLQLYYRDGYFPTSVSVVYQLEIQGRPVYEQGGYRYGLVAVVDIVKREVTSMYNLTIQKYDSSDYPVVTDIQDLLAKMNERNTYPYGPEVQVETRTIGLGTPELVWTPVYSYTNGRSNQLLAPAYRFPVLEKPGTDPYYPDSIVAVLPQDLVEPVYWLMKGQSGGGTVGVGVAEPAQ